MYIPISYLSSQQNLCISASGGDDIEVFISGSEVWKIHSFTTPGNHTYQIHSGSAPHKLIVVGAGGSGGIKAASQYGGAGGGGAGGFIFLDNLPMSSGSYDIYVGSGSLPYRVDDYNGSGVSGQSSTFNYIYTPTSPDNGYYIPSSTITAYGGGHGGSLFRIVQPDPPPPQFVGTGVSNGANGASGGGGAITNGYFTNKISQPGNALYNLNGLPPHGFKGGGMVDNGDGGSGGGGASSSASFNDVSGNGGASFNIKSLTGLDLSFSGGGTAQRIDGREYTSPSFKGSGGSGVTWNSTNFNRGKGQDGQIILMYKVCDIELETCTEYRFNGGALGGNITYIPCGGGDLTSSSVSFDQEGVICVYKTDTYPSASGTVSLIQTGSCDTNIPIVPIPTCDTGSGEVTTPVYIYDYTLNTICYPTFLSCQTQYTVTGTLTYTNREGNAITSSIGGGFVSNTGQICAREIPAPTLSNGSIVKSDLICGYYCSGSI